MLKEEIEYEDYSGTVRKETFYFNLSKAEVTKMEMSTEGGLVEKINRMVAAQDGKEIMNFFEEIILKAYGVKSPDGRRFIKSPELSKEFAETEAYNVLFMRIVTNADVASAFVKGLLPAVPNEPPVSK